MEQEKKELAKGYTTGSCAAAAAGAAARMLFGREELSAVSLVTPRGITLQLDLEEITVTDRAATCAVRKDAGDDPDVTDGVLVYATVSRSRQPGIRIDGGAGIGRVTKPGLDQPVGAAAINATPRRMITQEVQAALQAARVQEGGADVVISIPAGTALAQKTFNPKLGIVGGISVLGTTGIVEPMSEQALLDTIAVEIRVRSAEHFPLLPMAPGNYGRSFMQDTYGFSLDLAVECSNFVGDAVTMAVQAGFTSLLLVGHIGKLVKVAGGILNTHSKYGDHRMEILSGLAREAMGDQEQEALLTQIGACVSTDEAVRLLREAGLDRVVLQQMTQQIKQTLEQHAGGRLQVEVVVFSNVYGTLGKTAHAVEAMQTLEQFVASQHKE